MARREKKRPRGRKGTSRPKPPKGRSPRKPSPERQGEASQARGAPRPRDSTGRFLARPPKAIDPDTAALSFEAGLRLRAYLSEKGGLTEAAREKLRKTHAAHGRAVFDNVPRDKREKILRRISFATLIERGKERRPDLFAPQGSAYNTDHGFRFDKAGRLRGPDGRWASVPQMRKAQGTERFWSQIALIREALGVSLAEARLVWRAWREVPFEDLKRLGLPKATSPKKNAKLILL